MSNNNIQKGLTPPPTPKPMQPINQGATPPPPKPSSVNGSVLSPPKPIISKVNS